MRVEQLRAECNKFKGEDECFLHCEKTTTGQYAILIGGDVKTMFFGIYFMLNRLAEVTQISMKQWLSMMTETSKHGNTKTTFANAGQLRKHTQSETFAQEKAKLNREVERLQQELEDCKRISAQVRMEQLDRYNKLDARYVKANREIRALEKKVSQLEAENASLRNGGEF